MIIREAGRHKYTFELEKQRILKSMLQFLFSVCCVGSSWDFIVLCTSFVTMIFLCSLATQLLKMTFEHPCQTPLEVCTMGFVLVHSMVNSRALSTCNQPSRETRSKREERQGKRLTM